MGGAACIEWTTTRFGGPAAMEAQAARMAKGGGGGMTVGGSTRGPLPGTGRTKGAMVVAPIVDVVGKGGS